MPLKSDKHKTWIDGCLYPDTETPNRLSNIHEKVDFLARLCSAWDFGILPDHEVIQEIQKKRWRKAVDACNLLTSPAYHLLRKWHGLSRLPYLGQTLAYIQNDPNLKYV